MAFAPNPSVAFLGLGLMGLPMSVRIAGAGYPTRIWNRSDRDLRAAIEAGAEVSSSIQGAVEKADVVIIMVSNSDAVDDVLFSDGGVAASARSGACVVVMSSIPPDTAQRQALVLEQHGLSYVDAPVSGGEVGAQGGALAIMAGGDADIVAAVAPVIEATGRVTHVGPVGAGQVVKLANQLIVGVTIGAVAEALLLVKAAGADTTSFRSAIAGGFADSTILKIHGQRMVNGDFAPGAHASTQLKDLDTALKLSKLCKLDLPMLRKATELYDALCRSDYSNCDHSVLYKWLADNRRQVSQSTLGYEGGR